MTDATHSPAIHPTSDKAMGLFETAHIMLSLASKESAKESAKQVPINYMYLMLRQCILAELTKDMKKIATQAADAVEKTEAFHTAVNNLLREKNYSNFNLSVETQSFVNAITALEITRKKYVDKYNSLREISYNAKLILSGLQKKRKRTEDDDATKRQ